MLKQVQNIGDVKTGLKVLKIQILRITNGLQEENFNFQEKKTRPEIVLGGSHQYPKALNMDRRYADFYVIKWQSICK